MHDQIRRDLDCAGSALKLMAIRRQLAVLVAEWKAAGGSEPLPTIEERLKANHRPAQKRDRHSAMINDCRPERSMDRNLVLINRNIARLRRDVRLQSSQIEQLIAADLDCTPAAQRLMRAQADLVLFIEKRERLMAPAAHE